MDNKDLHSNNYYLIGFLISLFFYSIIIGIGYLINISNSFKEILITFAIITSIANGYYLNYKIKKTLDIS